MFISLMYYQNNDVIHLIKIDNTTKNPLLFSNNVNC